MRPQQEPRYVPGGSLLATSGLSNGYSDPNVPLLSDGVMFNRAVICVCVRETEEEREQRAESTL